MNTISRLYKALCARTQARLIPQYRREYRSGTSKPIRVATAPVKDDRSSLERFRREMGQR